MKTIVTTSRKRRPQRGKPSLPWPVIGCAVVLVAGFAALRILRRAETQPPTPPSAPSTVSTSPTVSTSSTTSTPATPPEGVASTPSTSSSPSADSASSTVAPAPQGGASTSTPSAEAGTKLPGVEDDAALKMAAEQFLAFVIGANEEVESPPPPAMDESQLRHDLMIALTNDIVVFDDESPENQKLKENVAEAKQQLKKIMDEGGSLEQAIAEYRNWKREIMRMRSEVRGEYARLRTEGLAEEAAAYLEEANKALEAEGIEPIVLGPPRRKKSVRNGDPPPPKKAVGTVQ